MVIVNTEKVDLRFRLKGARTYVHGPDIFDALCEVLGDRFGVSTVRDLRFTVHNPLWHHGVVQLILEEQQVTNVTAPVTLRFNAEGRKWVALVHEVSEVVAERQEFPEEEIVAKCIIDVPERRVTVRGIFSFSAMEVWVAANKFLHQKLFADEKGGWWFAKVEISQCPGRAAFDETTIALVHNFNRKLTKSRITVDGESRGYIYFSARRT